MRGSDKRLLITSTEYPPYRGGVATYAHSMAAAADRLGWDTTVWAPDYGRADAATSSGAHVLRYRGGVPTLWDLPYLTLQLAKAYWKVRPSCLLIASWPDAICAAVLRLEQRCRCVVMCHGTELLYLPYARTPRYLGYRRFIENARVVSCNSRFTAGLLKRANLAIRGEVRVVPLGVDPYWSIEVDRTSMRSRWSVPSGDWVLSTVARLDERKGQDLALSALCRLPDDVQRRITYLVVGPQSSGAYAQRLRELAAQTRARVIFTGAVVDDEVREILAGSDVFLLTGKDHPARVEGFGLVLLEAASQGVPSLATSIGGVPEVVVHGETGVLVPGATADSVARALADLLQNDTMRRRLGENARAHARKFTWERTARETLEGR
jgi:phosphatidyl-myo-inositol dimannoside synthase